jgi:hypothetical protein
MRDVVKVEKTALIKTSIGEYKLSTSIAKKVQEYVNSTTLESLDKDNITRLAETPDKGQMEVNTEMQKEIGYIKLAHFRILNKVVLKNIGESLNRDDIKFYAENPDIHHLKNLTFLSYRENEYIRDTIQSNLDTGMLEEYDEIYELISSIKEIDLNHKYEYIKTQNGNYYDCKATLKNHLTLENGDSGVFNGLKEYFNYDNNQSNSNSTLLGNPIYTDKTLDMASYMTSYFNKYGSHQIKSTYSNLIVDSTNQNTEDLQNRILKLQTEVSIYKEESAFKDIKINNLEHSVHTLSMPRTVVNTAEGYVDNGSKIINKELQSIAIQTIEDGYQRTEDLQKQILELQKIVRAYEEIQKNIRITPIKMEYNKAYEIEFSDEDDEEQVKDLKNKLEQRRHELEKRDWELGQLEEIRLELEKQNIELHNDLKQRKFDDIINEKSNNADLINKLEEKIKTLKSELIQEHKENEYLSDKIQKLVDAENLKNNDSIEVDIHKEKQIKALENELREKNTVLDLREQELSNVRSSLLSKQNAENEHKASLVHTDTQTETNDGELTPRKKELVERIEALNMELLKNNDELQDKNLAVKQLQEQLEGVYTRDEVESIMHEVEADKQRLSEQNDLLLEKLEADNLKQNKIIQSMEKETQEKDGIIEKQGCENKELKDTNEKQALENKELKDTIEEKDILLDMKGVQINILSENLNKEMEGNKKYLHTIDQLKGDKKTLNDYNKLLQKDVYEQSDEISGLKLQLCNEKKKASIFDDTKFINTKISEFDTSKTFAEILNEVTNSNQIDLNNADNFKTDLSGNYLQSDECN